MTGRIRSARAAVSLALRSDPAVQPPSFAPRRLAAARPALVRCEMSARSFCASVHFISGLMVHRVRFVVTELGANVAPSSSTCSPRGALDLRQIRKVNVHAGVEQHRQKSDRAGEPIDLRHDNRDLAHASSGQSLRQRGTLAIFQLPPFK
jgi:hypothetical protein